MSETSSLFTAKARSVGGREGRATAERGTPSLPMALPPAFGGPEDPGEATNPEELFALGYGACFLSTVQFIARSQKISAKDFTVDTAVSLLQAGEGFQLGVSLDVTTPGVEQATAAELVRAAHGTCVYSKAIQGNVEVDLRANGQPV